VNCGIVVPDTSSELWKLNSYWHQIEAMSMRETVLAIARAKVHATCCGMEHKTARGKPSRTSHEIACGMLHATVHTMVLERHDEMRHAMAHERYGAMVLERGNVMALEKYGWMRRVMAHARYDAMRHATAHERYGE
jgi:hypothetical protein